MNDLHKITADWRRMQSRPQPALVADQPPAIYDLDARNGPLPNLTLKEATSRDPDQFARPRSGAR
jgi:hypothetical protein